MFFEDQLYSLALFELRLLSVDGKACEPLECLRNINYSEYSCVGEIERDET